MSLRYVIATDRGRERENNEDAALGVPELGLFVIADGMGGHLGGEIASQVAIDSLLAFVKGHGPARDLKDGARLLSEAVLEANSAVLHEAELRELSGMGTTLTALQIAEHTATICHVGDTRAALLQDGELSVLTRDHNIASLMVDQGIIPAAQATLHPERHMLTQAVGTSESIDPDIVQVEIPHGARILLSTDGLHDVVPADVIAELANQKELEDAAQALIEQANERGGPDNVTVILIEP